MSQSDFDEHMDDDDLDLDLGGAFRAVREEFDGSHPDPAATLRGALLRTRIQERKRRVTKWVVLPLAAAFAASTAWAGVTGRLAPALSSIAEVLHAEHTKDPSIGSGGPVAIARSAAAPTAPLTSVGAATIPPPAPEPVAAPTVSESVNGTTGSANAANEASGTGGGAKTPTNTTAAAANARPAAPASATVNAAPTTKPFEVPPVIDPTPPAPPANEREAALAADPYAALFADAHRAHFIDKDPSRALAAWDKYLAAAPSGKLAPEARYNRAITLVRLGRNDDAKRELSPFANGTFGNYRREEAKALVDALERDR